MARKDDEAYCFDLLKEGIVDSSMSGKARVWCVVVGIIGMFIIDPVLFIFNKLGIDDDKPTDPDDPNGPFNTNY